MSENDLDIDKKKIFGSHHDRYIFLSHIWHICVSPRRSKAPIAGEECPPATWEMLWCHGDKPVASHCCPRCNWPDPCPFLHIVTSRSMENIFKEYAVYNMHYIISWSTSAHPENTSGKPEKPFKRSLWSAPSWMFLWVRWCNVPSRLVGI